MSPSNSPRRRRWLPFIAINFVQFVVLLAALLTWPSLTAGWRGWAIWLPVIAVNILAARRYRVPPQNA